MKLVLSNFIGEWVEELQDGFVDGMSDVHKFFRENFRIMLEVAGGPSMGGMISGMGTDSMLTAVINSYKSY